MDTSMDSITIEVNSAAKNSTADVDTLITKLDKLRNSLQKVIDTSSKFSELKMPSVSTTSGITNSVNKSKSKAPYSEYGDAGTQFNALGIDPDKLGDSSYATLTKSVETAISSLKQYKLATGEVVTVSEQAKNGLEGVKVSLENVSKSTEKGTSNWKSFTSGLSKVINVALIKKLGTMAGTYFKQAADYLEADNLFTVTLNDNLSDANKFANEFSTALHIDPAELEQYMGSFNSLIKGLGVGTDSAYLMSKNMTQLVYDLSSFKNLSTETAFRKLQSAMSGKIICLIRKGLRIVINLIQWNSKHIMV